MNENNSIASTASPSINRRRFGRLARLAITVILVSIILSLIDLSAVIDAISNSNPLLVPLIIALAMLDRFIMAYKWAMLLRARGIPITNMEAFRIYLLSSFAGTFLPTSVGADAVKLARTTLSTGNIEKVAASILMERSIGVMALIALGLIGLSFVIARGEQQFLPIFYTTAIVFGGLGLVVALSLRNDVYRWLDTRLTRWKKYKLARMILDSHSAYVDLGGHKRVLLWFFLLSMLEHALLTFVNYCGGLALSLPVHFVYFMAIIPIAGVIEMFPISIGGIGVAEGMYIVLFALAGLSAEEALSLAIYMRAVGLLAVTPGAIIFVQDSMRLRRLRANRKQG